MRLHDFLKMVGTGVLECHAFSQSSYTLVAGSSCCAGLDHILKEEII